MDSIKESDLLDEIITILMAALSIAGVKDEKMQEALEIYEKLLDEVDDDIEYDYKSIKYIILSMRETHKELFK